MISRNLHPPVRRSSRLYSAVMLLALAVTARAAPLPPNEARLAALVRDPTPGEWHALARFDGTLTRLEFETRLNQVFDPEHGLRDYLKISNQAVTVYPIADKQGDPLVIVHFAPTAQRKRPQPEAFRSPGARPRPGEAIDAARPLAGLHVVIEPADIGGAWAKMEDRSVNFPGYGRINEGDLNLIVGRILRTSLAKLGADVFLVRDRAEPILPIAREHLLGLAEDLLYAHPASLPASFQPWAASLRTEGFSRLRIAAGLLLTKTMETRARAALVQRSFRPDITLVLQHDATPDSAEGQLTPINRNIFFVDGAYLPSELRDPWQRFRLLTKLLEDVTPIESTVATAIAARFRLATGFPPVLYGNSATTRLVIPGNPYVVARNLDFNREHDGPVVVIEPYFMNQPETLTRLLAGDYPGQRVVAGRMHPSIFREYANCVVAGLLDAYGTHAPTR